MSASTKDDGMPKDREYIRLVDDKISNDEREELLLVEEYLYVIRSCYTETWISRENLSERFCVLKSMTDINE